MVDLKLLEDTIKKKGLKLNYIAQEMHITRYTLRNKLDGIYEFTASEMSALKTILRLTQSEFRHIFFATESELNSRYQEVNE